MVGVAVVPQQINAASFLDGPINSVINNSLAWVVNTILAILAWLLTLSGVFLSVSINLTTHIGDFFDKIPALKEVWIVVRNISSIFIIFFLLYFSILTITGSGTSKLKELVKNIIIVGLLINFSLFFSKILIDASNIVSLQFYRAIAPQSSQAYSVKSVFNDGGLSDVFMSSLKIPQIYQNKNALKGADVFLGITFAGIGGILMMITAIFSFLAAAIAFTARTGILLFIMALSPLYFAAMIFPQIKKEISDKLMKTFKGQLLFMPAYLFLMYVALKLISSDGFKTIFNQSATGVPAASEGVIGPTIIGVIIQYVIALLFINAPLIMAIKLGAVGAKWAPQAGTISKWIGSNTWKNTGSRVASRVAQSEGFQRFAGNSIIGEQLLKGAKGIAKGYDKSLGERLAKREATYNSLTDNTARTNYAQRLATSPLTRYSMAGLTGRADRVGAARILTKRQAEINTDFNRLTGELNHINNAANQAGGIVNLPLYQQQRHDELTGQNNYGANPTLVNEITNAQNDMNNIRTQINAFQTGVGATAKQVNKRNY